jgi:hypothetical protein
VPAERCSFCGRKAGARLLRLKSGQNACPRCRETGYFQRLACGHFALPGALRVNENGDGKTFVCGNCCSPGAAASFGFARLGQR